MSNQKKSALVPGLTLNLAPESEVETEGHDKDKEEEIDQFNFTTNPQDTSATGGTLRRSNRENAGKPPSRLGNPVDIPPRKRCTTRKDFAEILAKSIISVSSNSKVHIEDAALKATSAIHFEQNERQRKIKVFELDVKNIQKKLASEEKKLKNAKSDEEIMKIQESIDTLTKSLEIVTDDLERDRIDFEHSEKIIPILLKNIESEANVKIAELEEEGAKKTSVVDKNKTVEDWIQDTNPDSQDEEDYQTDEEELAILTEKLVKIRGDADKTKTSKEKPPPPAPPTSFDAVAEAFAKAFTGLLPNSTIPHHNSTDKLLSRQIHGRDLPIFNGSAEEWASFISTYETSTKNCRFSNAENLVRLQRCLKGEAKQTVQSLLVSEANVPQVIEKLRIWFGRPDIIINSMIAKTRATPTVRSDKPEGLVELGRTVDNLVATVTALNQADQLSSPFLVKEIADKLPRDLQLQWSLEITKSNIPFPTLAHFATWFNPYVQAARRLCPETPSQIKNENRNPGRGRQNHVNVANEKKKGAKENDEEQRTQRNQCIECSSTEHRIWNCPQFKSKSIDEKWTTVKKERACFSCLGKGHSFVQCRTKRNCAIDGCQKQHNRLLHNPKLKPEETKQEVKIMEEEASSSSEEDCNIAHGASKINFLVVPALARNKKKELVPVYLAFDSYSSLTATSAETAKLLGLKGEKKRLTVNGFQETTTIHDSQVINIEVASCDNQFTCTLRNVKTVPELNLPSQSLPLDVIKSYDHLRKLDLKPFKAVVPTILVGMDHFELHYHLDIRRGKKKEPAAIKTAFGWAVVGTIPEKKDNQHHNYKMQEIEEDSLHQLVKHFFSTEALGVEHDQEKPRSREDVRAQQILDSTVRRTPNGWETGLLWKSDEVRLPKTKNYALKRLHTMERKMDRDPEFAHQYMGHVTSFFEKGYAKVLSPGEAESDNDKTFYLPHFLAYNEKKSNKYRFVFDAAAKVEGSCLNDHLLQGPDKLASLVGILVQFRQGKIAVTGDIKDFFPRIKVRKDDYNAQRFLWRGMDRHRTPDVCRMESVIFGATCSPTCALEVKDKNASESKEEFPLAYVVITKKHYMDDCLYSCDSIQEAIQLQQQVTEVHSKGSFQICNWLSNSPEVMQTIPEESHAKSFKNLDGKEKLMERVLGIFWRPETDDLTFQLRYLKAKQDIQHGEKIPTKREVLSLVMSLFDPLGLLTILIVKAKIILQATWRSKIGWDDAIPHSTFELWKIWLQELSRIENFSVPRCYSFNFSTADQIQLHIFCDGGEEAFGTVAFFRIVKNGEVDTALIMAKSNVAPIKALSIPRLELQAALMGARLSKFIKTTIEYPINRLILWTDSSTVLKQIRAEGRRFEQFVATRIGKIQRLTEISEWRWIPTAENVADDITRFAKPCDWSNTGRWINGPPWLKAEEHLWPQEPHEVSQVDEDKLEMKKNQVFIAISQDYKSFYDDQPFSSWRKLSRVTAYVLRFINLVTKKIPIPSSCLSVLELKEAEIAVVKMIQQDSFGLEINMLKIGKDVDKKSRLLRLNPSLVDNVIVVRGRLDNAKCLSPLTRRPAVIDPKHQYGKLLIDHFHVIMGHHGREKIANEVQQQYHVLGLRTAIRQSQLRCQVCNNRKVMPRPPEMGQLPNFRVQEQIRPFIKTGLDYFGPVEVNVKRSREKKYVALFTCLSTRAVHLELAGSLSTDSCILALRRFVARRGCPTAIHSDNGTNFVGANEELKKSLQELNQSKIEDFCASKLIDWHFNPPSAPHMGGSWERMVRAVKVALGDTLRRKNLTEEVLMTFLTEAEHSVNSHPLTHVPDDPNDQEALTPNHFLIGQSSNLQPFGHFSDHDLYSRKQWRIVQVLANHFWKRWVKEYLPTLLRRDKWNKTTKPIEVGDVVLEVNPNLPRNQWPKGRVTKIFPGQDGVVRVVDVTLANRHTYRRPVAKLCILDVQNPIETTGTKPSPDAEALQDKNATPF